MANIVISDLRPAGSEFFMDSESYMTDLSEDELGLEGGISPLVTSSVWCIRTAIIVVTILSSAKAY
jgi:hypothetical protein